MNQEAVDYIKRIDDVVGYIDTWIRQLIAEGKYKRAATDLGNAEIELEKCLPQIVERRLRQSVLGLYGATVALKEMCKKYDTYDEISRTMEELESRLPLVGFMTKSMLAARHGAQQN